MRRSERDLWREENLGRFLLIDVGLVSPIVFGDRIDEFADFLLFSVIVLIAHRFVHVRGDHML